MKQLEQRYDRQDDIPEEARALYEERDGAWHLAVQITGLEDVAGLKEKNRELLGTVAQLKREAKELPDLKAVRAKLDEAGVPSIDDAIEAWKHREEFDAAAIQHATEGKVQEALQRQAKKLEDDKKALEDAKNAVINQVTAERDGALAELNTTRVEGDITRTLDELGVRDADDREYLTMKFKPLFRWDRERGKTVPAEEVSDPYDKQGNELTTKTAIGEWVNETQARRERFLPVNRNQDAAPPGDVERQLHGPNPFKPLNRTLAFALRRDNPELAERAAKAAGYKTAHEALVGGGEQPMPVRRGVAHGSIPPEARPNSGR